MQLSTVNANIQYFMTLCDYTEYTVHCTVYTTEQWIHSDTVAESAECRWRDFCFREDTMFGFLLLDESMGKQELQNPK